MQQNNNSKSPKNAIDTDAAIQPPKLLEKAPNNTQPESRKHEESSPEAENIHSHSPPRTMERNNNIVLPNSAPEKSADANAAIQESKEPESTQNGLSEQEESLPEAPAGDNISHTPILAPWVPENPPKRRRMNPMESPIIDDEFELPPSVNP